jgi:hypothetical protein
MQGIMCEEALIAKHKNSPETSSVTTDTLLKIVQYVVK